MAAPTHSPYPLPTASAPGPASTASSAVTPADTIFDFAKPCDGRLERPACPTSSASSSPSDVTGTVTGIRFYKAAANTGTHIGSLWTAGGTLLASATFTSESPVRLADRPVLDSGRDLPRRRRTSPATSIPTGTTPYISAAFNSSFDNAPLHAVANNTQRQWRLQLHLDIGLPDEHIQRQQLLGRRAVPAHAARPADWRRGDRRVRCRDRELVGARNRRSYEVHGHALHRRHRSNRYHRDRHPAGDHGDRHRPDRLEPPTRSRCRPRTPTAPARCRRASNSATPLSAAAPAAPTGVTASPSTTQALVSWNAAAPPTAAPVTSYTVTPYLGRAAQTPVTGQQALPPPPRSPD